MPFMCAFIYLNKLGKSGPLLDIAAHATYDMFFLYQTDCQLNATLVIRMGLWF